MKKYLVSLTIKEIEAISSVEAINEFDKLIASKQLGIDCYTVKELEDLPIVEQ